MAGTQRELDLSGCIVGVTADRRGDDQTLMFTRLGAEVITAATLSTRKVPDPVLLRRRTETVISDPPDFLIANTGIGIRTWMEQASDWGLYEQLRSALTGVRIAARGPKAAGALTSHGLSSWWRSPSEQLGDVLGHLEEQGLDGRKVTLQLHGDDGSEVVGRLERAGASVETLPVYEWGPPTDPEPVHRLIDATCAGRVDAITFTAGPQVDSLMAHAERQDRRQELLDRLNSEHVVVGCIGPVCASAAAARGIRSPVVPHSWRLGSLVKAVAAALTSR